MAYYPLSTKVGSSRYPNLMAVPLARGMVVLGGNSTPELTEEIARRIGVPVAESKVSNDSSNETNVHILESIRGKDVFIVQTGYSELSPVYDNIMEMLIMCYACKTSSARKIIAVIPYLPYSKQCMMKRRGCITAKLLAAMMSRAGVCHLVTMDLYHKEIQGFFDFPVDNMRGSPFLIQYIMENIPEYKEGVVVAKYPGVTRRASSFAERLNLKLAVIHGEKRDIDDERHSPPPEPLPRSRVVMKMKPPIDVVGDVKGKLAFLIDDVLEEADGIISAAQCLKDKGASTVHVVATHALLPGDAPRQIDESIIDQVLVTNTIPQEHHARDCKKLKTIDISMIMAEAVRRIYHGESMSYLFKNIPLED